MPSMTHNDTFKNHDLTSSVSCWALTASLSMSLFSELFVLSKASTRLAKCTLKHKINNTVLDISSETSTIKVRGPPLRLM